MQPYGVVDTADLKLKSCDFEKDANAEILFNYCVAKFDGVRLVLNHHKRLKIFNFKASADLGNVTITVPNNKLIKKISNLKAETINLNNGKIDLLPLDKKSFIKQKINKWISHIVFAFSSLKDGSILEYSYTETIEYAYHIPDWYFQGKLPVRYSACELNVPKGYDYYHKLFARQNLIQNTEKVTAMEKIPSLADEPYMDTYLGNLQHVSFIMGSRDATGKVQIDKKTWQQIGAMYMSKQDYGQQLSIKLPNEEKLINKVKDMKPEEKMASLFKMIRDTLTADDEDEYINDNAASAWTRKYCSSELINIILCRLLNQAGLEASLVAVSSDPDDRIYSSDPVYRNLDETVVHVKIADDKYFMLDASEKDSHWDQIPYNLLNTYGLYMNIKNSTAGLIFIEDKSKARNVVFVNADISADGKMQGTAQIVNAGYNRIRTAKKYNEDGEKKFTDDLSDNDNNLKISAYKIENMEVDTLPLLQNIDFTFDSPGTDENYIYLNPKLFSGFDKDPFINAKRESNIDFGFRNNYSINGHYTVPSGYKVDVLPKNASMRMPDTSIVFKQVSAVDDNVITVHYSIEYNRSYFGRDEYPPLYDFYKKMYEMLSQPIVLKKW